MDGTSLETKLRENGIGVTKPRIRILEYMMTHRNHPSVDVVFSELRTEMPTLSRTTVYNVLKLLSERGLVQMITIDDEHVNFDGDTAPHAHLLCRRCGCIIDLPLEETTAENAGKPYSIDGNLIEETHRYYRGLCAGCRELVLKEKIK